VGIESGGFQPPYLFGSGTGGSLSFIIGIGMLMIMPEIVKQTKTAIGVKEGIFSELTRDIGDSMKKGIKGGGEVIPGIGFTKIPGVADMAGWGGKQFNQYAVKPVAGQVAERYKAGGVRGIWPKKVQQMPSAPGVDIPKELAKGRIDSKTPLGKISTADRGIDAVKGNKQSGTM